MKINIKKVNWKPSSIGSGIILGIVLLYILLSFFVYTLHFPRIFFYVGDLLNCIAAVYAIMIVRAKGNKLSKNSPLLWMIIFSIIAISSSIINQESIILLSWGIRNNLRYFFFFFSCCILLDEQDLLIIIRIVKYVFWLSIPLCTYQALFVTYSPGTIVGDMVGGVFFNFSGCNTPLNVILLIQVSIITIAYFNESATLKKLVVTTIAAVYMSALAELKVFIIELVIIFVLVMFWKRINIRTILFSVFGIAVLSLTVSWLIYFNGTGKGGYEELLTVSGLIEYATRSSGYDGVGDLNRITAIPVLYQRFLSANLSESLIGIGLGNADYSQNFAILQSDFYRKYFGLHYQWFSSSFIFIETGILGIFSQIMIFASSYMSVNKQIEKKNPYSQLSKLISVIMLFLFFYNTSLRMEQCAYLLYLLLAIPFIISKRRTNIL